MTIGIVIYIFAWELVYYSAGVQYIDSVEVLRIHILGGIFLSIGVAGGKWIIAENYPRGALYKANDRANGEPRFKFCVNSGVWNTRSGLWNCSGSFRSKYCVRRD